jgi:hypothetical protein
MLFALGILTRIEGRMLRAARNVHKQKAKVGGCMRRVHQKISTKVDADALFLGTGIRAIARKTLPTGYTIADLQQFLSLLYGLFDEKEAKEVRVYDPFAQERGRRVTVARLADALANLIAAQAKSA